MRIKKNCEVYLKDDFWYDLTDGGYLKPEEICEDEEDVKRIKEAIAVLKDFYDSCEEQIEGFIQ
jgi:hypothetical protein